MWHDLRQALRTLRKNPAFVALASIVLALGIGLNTTIFSIVYAMLFTPTRSSWLNLVEPWFAHLSQRRLRRGEFCSVTELTTAIYQYIDHNNAHAKPFIWTAPAARLLDKARKCRAISESLH
jgi:hypothetical protein